MHLRSALDQEGGWTGMGAPSHGQAGPDLQHTGNDNAGMPDWDDDDLAAMQAEPMVKSSGLIPKTHRCCWQCYMHCLASWLLCSKDIYGCMMEFHC